jgi:hypothetical protein
MQAPAQPAAATGNMNMMNDFFGSMQQQAE